MLFRPVISLVEEFDLTVFRKSGRLLLFKKLNLLKSLEGVVGVEVVKLVLEFLVIVEVFCGALVTALFDMRLETPPKPFADFI